MSARRPPMQTHGYEQTCNAACSYTNPEEWVLDETGGEHGSEGLTFDMSGGAKGAKQPLGRPLDGGVRCLHRAHGGVLPNAKGLGGGGRIAVWPTS
jgi:hypothetical protein